MVETSDRRTGSGFARGWGHVARGWRLLCSHRVLLLVALALGAVAVLGPRLSDLLVGPLKPQDAVSVEQEDQGEGDLGRFPQLVGLHDVLWVVPRLPGTKLGIGDAFYSTRPEKILGWVWQLLFLAAVWFDVAVSVLVVGVLVSLLAGLVARGVLDWRAAARGGIGVFWRYLALTMILSLPHSGLSLLAVWMDPPLPALVLTGLYLVIEVLRLTLILAWFSIAADDMSFVRAVLVSGSTIWKRFSETAVVVLGIGLVRLVWVAPASRLIGHACEVVYGGGGPPMAGIAVDVVIWSILLAIEIWFCLSALAWWTAIREDSAPASPRQKGCQTSHA